MVRLAGRRRISVTITLPVETYLGIDQIAVERDTSFSSIVGELIKLGTVYQKVLADQEKLHLEEEVQEKLKAIKAGAEGNQNGSA